MAAGRGGAAFFEGEGASVGISFGWYGLTQERAYVEEGLLGCRSLCEIYRRPFLDKCLRRHGGWHLDSLCLRLRLGVCPSNRSAKLLVGKFSRISGHGEDLS